MAKTGRLKSTGSSDAFRRNIPNSHLKVSLITIDSFPAPTRPRNRRRSFPCPVNDILLSVPRVNGIIDSRVRARCCGIMGTMMELCGLTQSTFEVRKKFTSLHARARINGGYTIAGVSMVATIFPHGNSITYYGYVKFEENLTGHAYRENTKCLAAEYPRGRDRFTPRLCSPSHAVPMPSIPLSIFIPSASN